jgi:hypothetical protein
LSRSAQAASSVNQNGGGPALQLQIASGRRLTRKFGDRFAKRNVGLRSAILPAFVTGAIGCKICNCTSRRREEQKIIFFAE